MKEFLKQRVREPSTWAGVGSVLSMGATAYATRDPNAIGAVIAGLVAMFMKEKGAK